MERVEATLEDRKRTTHYRDYWDYKGLGKGDTCKTKAWATNATRATKETKAYEKEKGKAKETTAPTRGHCPGKATKQAAKPRGGD